VKIADGIGIGIVEIGFRPVRLGAGSVNGLVDAVIFGLRDKHYWQALGGC